MRHPLVGLWGLGVYAGCVPIQLGPGPGPDRPSGDDTAAADPGCEDPATWYNDADGDGYGDPATAERACLAPEGAVASSGDCDDQDPDTWPGAPEWCDGRDTDCDGDSADLGRVTWTPRGGAPEDLSATFAAGSVGSPRTVLLSEDGALAVCPGTYTVSLTLTEAELAVTGLGGAAQTTLSGGGRSAPLVTDRATATVSGLTLQEGQGAYGGGLVCREGALTLDGVVLQGNHADAAGGGFYAHGGCVLTASMLTLVGNTSGGTAGAGLLDGASLSASGLVVQDNTAFSTGGGLYVLGGSLDAEDCTLSGNVATRGGALALTEAEVALSGCTLSDNRAEADAGLVLSEASTLTLHDSLVQDNSALNAGGALLLYDGSAATLTDSEVRTNTARLGGGAYATLDTTLRSSGTRWISNDPEDIYHDVSWWFDHGVAFTCAAGSCVLD